MAKSPPKKPRVSHFLRQWRKQRGKTLVYVAGVSGYSESYLSQVETGQRRVNGDILDGYSKALNLTRGALLEHAPLSSGAVIDLSDPALIRGLWEEIPDDVRPQALRTLRSFSRGGQ